MSDFNINPEEFDIDPIKDIIARKSPVEDLNPAAAEFAKAFDQAPTSEAKEEVIRASFAAQGNVKASEIASMCDLADRAAQIALTEVIQTAKAVGSDIVPVALLEEFAKDRSVLSLVMWEAVDKFDLLADGEVNVPDDLSEIFENGEG